MELTQLHFFGLLVSLQIKYYVPTHSHTHSLCTITATALYCCCCDGSARADGGGEAQHLLGHRGRAEQGAHGLQGPHAARGE
jgi:hypothetical protein